MLALLGFVFVGLFSPGPNIIFLTASGARFGFRANLPHIAGIAIGVGCVAGFTGLGVGALLLAAPSLTLVLQIAACLWILYMAWGLWNAGPAQQGDAAGRPWTFPEALLFQAINPKVWAVALSATAYVTHLTPTGQAATLAPVFMGINVCVCLFWTAAGTLLGYLLAHPRAWTVFLRIMAVALAGFSVLVFL